MSIQKTALRLLRTALQSPQARRAAGQVVRRGFDEIQRRRGRSGDTAAKPLSDQHEGHTASDSVNAPSAQRSTRPAAATAPLPDRLADQPVAFTYAPSPNGHADPGEVVWAWVPYEEDPSKGKDRPVLIVSVEGPVLVGLMLTSRDRGSGDHTDAHGNRWVDVGSGAWDRQGRPSEVRVDRLLQLRPEEVRREGGRIDQQTFLKVANATREVFGW